MSELSNRARDFVRARGGSAKDDSGKNVGSTWQMLLDMADKIEQMERVLDGYESWEAAVIMDDGCWRGENGLPEITQRLWDRLLVLQLERNAALDRLTFCPNPRINTQSVVDVQR